MGEGGNRLVLKTKRLKERSNTTLVLWCNKYRDGGVLRDGRLNVITNSVSFCQPVKEWRDRKAREHVV